MKLPSDRIPLLSPDFDDILKATHSFHDGSLACACFDFHGPMAFIGTIWFGQELGYNPQPIIGGVFWFDLSELTKVHHLGSYYDRAIDRISLNKKANSIRINFQNEPYEHCGQSVRN